MNPHRAGMDYLLGIDERTDDPATEQSLLLTKALTLLRGSKPKNWRNEAEFRAARKHITAALKRAA